MCRKLPDIPMDFGICEISEDMAATIRRDKKIKQEPGFIWYFLKAEDPKNGKTQEKISDMILWMNAHKGYLGVMYHEWPWKKRLAAHFRIWYTKLIFWPVEAEQSLKPRQSDHVLTFALISAD